MSGTSSAEVVKHTQQSSVSIDRTSTGKHSISIKVYDDDPETALNRAVELLADAEARIALAAVDGGAS